MSDIDITTLEEPEATAALQRTGLNIVLAADALKAPGKMILRAAHGNDHSILGIRIKDVTLVLHLNGGTKAQRAAAYRAICQSMANQTGTTPTFHA